jgi:CBS domain containing-hemolysin-like protein
MVTLILFFCLSIVFSFLCSIWEAVLLSITPSYINSQVSTKSSIGETLKAFKADIDRPLSAILTLNTIAHTVGAIGVGAQAAEVFNTDQKILGLSAESIVAAVMTLAILVLSEIIPKTIGANKWRSLVPFTVRSLSLLLTILAPFVWVSQLITKNLKNEKSKSVLSRTDFMALADVGKTSGALDEQESTIITNLLGLGETTVYDVMTPRSVIQSLDETMTLQAFFDSNKDFRFSRIPLYAGSPDKVTGMVLKDQVLKSILDGKGEQPLSSIKRDLHVTNQAEPLSELFNYMMQEKEHIAAVHDDYGTLVGIVSTEDVFETILGREITDETDAVADLQQLARKQWKERSKK